jgi:hypothetical protein
MIIITVFVLIRIVVLAHFIMELEERHSFDIILL